MKLLFRSLIQLKSCFLVSAAEIGGFLLMFWPVAWPRAASRRMLVRSQPPWHRFMTPQALLVGLALPNLKWGLWRKWKFGFMNMYSEREKSLKYIYFIEGYNSNWTLSTRPWSKQGVTGVVWLCVHMHWPYNLLSAKIPLWGHREKQFCKERLRGSKPGLHYCTCLLEPVILQRPWICL